MLEQAPSTWLVGELARPYGRGINLQMEWPDVVALRDKLIASDCPLYRDIDEAWRDVGVIGMQYGSREFLVQDPDGYLLRFAQSLGERPSTQV